MKSFLNIFFQKSEKRENADKAILSHQHRQNSKILNDRQEILAEVKTFYEQLFGQKAMSKSGLKTILALR